MQYSEEQKLELARTLYYIFKVDKTNPEYRVENGVAALDHLYYFYYKESEADPKHKDINTILSAPVWKFLSDILITYGKMSEKDKADGRKYGLNP